MTPPNPPGYPPPPGGGGYPPPQQPQYPPQQPPPGYPQQPPQGYQQPPPGYQQPYQQQPGYGPPGMQPQGQPPKKSNVLMWVLIGVGGFVLLLVLAAGIGSYVLYRTVKNVGFDSALMQKNPGLAMAKMVTAMNPDYQTVTSNDSAGTITVREKSTGKLVTLRFDPEKKTMVIVGDDGKEVKIAVTGDGNSTGGIEFQTPEGKLNLGTSTTGAPPAWVPAYPGSKTFGVGSSETPKGSAYSFGFKTSDPASKVISFYQDQLKSAGFTVKLITTTTTGQGAPGQGGMLEAEDSARNHNLVLIVAGDNGETNVSVTAVEEKK